MVNWSELAIFVTSVSGSAAVLIYAMQKSKCSHIECCCITCERNVTDGNKNDIEAQLERNTNDEPPADTAADLSTGV